MTVSKICKQSGNSFFVDDEELAFYSKMDVPVPDLCPSERKRTRMAWATLRALHRRVCDGTGKQILSMYGPDTKHPVYHSDYWWSDSWSPLDYGRDFDFSRPFFEQFDELFREVPALHQSVIHSENCEYINMAGHCKNCYLSFFLDYCEDCFYVQNANHDRSCVDCLGVNNSELCYECIDSLNCYNLLYSQRCVGCRDSYFLVDCRSCDHCIGCFNLTNKSYYIYNKPVSKKEFEIFKESLSSRKRIAELATFLAQESSQYPKRYYFGHSNEDFSGDDVYHLKNSYDCFHGNELENVRYADYFYLTSNSVDVSLYGNKSEWLYNCLKTGDQCSNNLCSLCCWTGSNNNAYCHLVISTKYCFGCSGLHHKQYCILNKQYSAEEYTKLRAKIVAHMKETGEWGRFFPIQMSPFPYNETIAQVYSPLSQSEALKLGYGWRENTEDEIKLSLTTRLSGTPDTISEVVDDIIKQPFECVSTGKRFLVTKQELSFYKIMNIPLPEFCPEVRHNLRFAKRNPLVLYKRTCPTCKVELSSTYPPSSTEAVLCDLCFQNVLD